MTDTVFSLNGEIALITGGGGGLGLGIARCFIRAGAKVILVGRKAAILEAATRELGQNACWISHDIARVDEVAALAHRATESFNAPPTILINNAGNHLKKPAIQTSPAEFENVMRTHVTAGHVLAAAFLPEMICRRHGSILFIASMASFIGVPSIIAYSAAKAAVLGMTRSLASEVALNNIRVNAIAPGWIQSDMLRQALAGDPARERKILDRTPMGRFGESEDIGWAATYLCSPAARFVTGTVLSVDGGALIGF